jgi:AcrR family transcriptional regulator
MMTDVNPVKSTRKQQAAATRLRIVEAATAEFVRNGYHGTSMAAIAKRAGVAVQTVYFVFHTKPELFAAAQDAAVLGAEDRPPVDQEWARSAAADSHGPAAAIRAFIAGSGPIFERAAALSQVARAAAPTDPDLRAVWESREELRVQGYRHFVTTLGASIPSDVDPLIAADIMITMVSPELYLAFRVERGWTHQQTIDWMAQTVPELMLRPRFSGSE